MSKMIKIYMLMVSVISISAYSSNTSNKTKKFGECTTQNDSMQMMIAAEVYTSKLSYSLQEKAKIHTEAMAKYNQKRLKNSKEFDKIQESLMKSNEISIKINNYTEEMGAVGRIINAKKYQEACDAYIAISKKYGGDIEKDSKTTITMKDLSKNLISKGNGCNAVETNVAIVLFTKKLSQNGKLNNPEVKEFLHNSALASLQKSNKICEKLKIVSSHVGISYDSLMKETKDMLRKSQKRVQKSKKIVEKNAQNNKICLINDAIALTYKKQDFSEKFQELEELWSDRYKEARHAKLKNNKLIKILAKKRKDPKEERHFFVNTFKKEVKIHISDGKYDLACENYKKLEDEYKKILLNLKKDYNTFNMKKESNTHVSAKDINNTDDAILATRKYNDIVNIINVFTPKIRNTFQTYARECGVDKKQRTRPKVDAAMATFSNGSKNLSKKEKKEYDQRRAMYDKSYGYHLVVYYGGSYKDRALEALDDALSIDSIKYANKAIKSYKEAILEFMKLYNEAFTYYDMQDYTEDNFKKAVTMHAPLIGAYEKVIEGDIAFREIIEEIENRQMLKRINKYKEENQMMFYYVEKSLYLSKIFLKEANKDDYMKLDSSKIKQLHKELRAHYSEFSTFKTNNETTFKDNNKYSYYLKIFREYVASSKKFYIRVKEKKPYGFGEKMLLNTLGRNNIEGSIYQLLTKYNKLIKNYNNINR